MNKTNRLRTNTRLPRFATGALALGAALLVAPLGLAQDDEEEIFELSPFTVEGTEDGGYRANSTLAGTRIRTNLRDVGSSISVMTDQFLGDTNSKNAEDLLVYATNTEVAGQSGNFVGQGDGAVLDTTDRKEPVTNTRVRGLDAADNTRGYFLTDIPWDGYNVSRVDIQRGPNSILFGIGSPAGIINSGLKGASFQDENVVELEFGRFGSNRVTANFNKVLIEDELAVRVALLRDRTEYRQDPAFKEDDRVYAALSWMPKALSSDSFNTELSVNYESGSVDSNNPRFVAPLDAITPWFTDLDQQTYSAVDGFDVTQAEPWIEAAGGRIFGGIVQTANGVGGDLSYVGQFQTWPSTGGGKDPLAVNRSRVFGIVTYNEYAKEANVLGSNIGALKARSLSDPTVFDFYNQLLEGDNKREFNDFTAANVAFRQNFFDNKLGYELAYDNQDAKWGYANFLSGDASSISVDVMNTLPDGTPNPNVGRPFVIAGGGSAGAYWENRERETYRFTGYGEYDFADSNSDTLGSILGRHVFTGLYSKYSEDDLNLSRSRYFLDSSYAPNATSPVGDSGRDVHIISYLGDSLLGASSPSGLRLGGIQGIQMPTSTSVRVWNNTWVPSEAYPAYNSNAPLEVRQNPANYVGWQTLDVPIVNTDDMAFRDRPYTGGQLGRNEIDSLAFVWQGYLFGGNVVPMVGWRKDEDEFRGAGSTIEQGGIFYLDEVPQWRLPEHEGDLWLAGVTNPTLENRQRTFNVEAGESLTKSLVVHMPSEWREHTFGIGVSLKYSESDNFKPDASRIDVFGRSIPSPTGTTKDYGIMFSAFEERLVFSVTKYKSVVQNATAGNEIANQYFIGAGEAWGQQYATQAMNRTNGFNVLATHSDNTRQLVYAPENDISTYSQAQIDAFIEQQDAALAAWFANPVPDAIVSAWGMNGYTAGSGQWSQPGGLAVTSDTTSEGYEFELTANPIDGFSLSVNASKTEARRDNLAKSYSDWLLERWEDMQGPMGDVRIWGPGYSVSNTMRQNYLTQPLAGLGLWRALEGSAVPELAEWRYNVVANYAFQDGPLAGANVGGSYRYQDAPTIGFPVIQVEGQNTFDVANGYKGESESNFDFWVGYERPLTDWLDWRIQANVRNAFDDKKLYPVTIQPDGSPGAYRIGAPTTWTISNTFTF